MRKAKDHLILIRETFVEFLSDLPFIHSAALSYYVLLSLVPLIYLAINIFGYFLGADRMLEIINAMFKEQVGISDASGIVSFLEYIKFGSGSITLKVVGTLIVLFSTTAMLNALKKSINKFYNIEKKQMGTKRVIVRNVLFRLISMLFILGITLLLVSLYFIETAMLTVSNTYLENLDLFQWLLSNVVRHGIPIVTNLIIFSFVFKYLHDGVVRWKVAIRGAVVTGIMLYLGQLLIKFYLMNYFFASNSGITGTILVLMVWVYYSALILFLGAKMTAAYAKYLGHPIIFRD